MNIQAILYAIEVAKTGNFSKAAENLYVTEPTISQQIKKLENELQLSLFLRTTRNVTLTSAGKVFLREAAPLVEAYHALHMSMRRESRKIRRSISIGMTTGLYPLHLPKFITQYGHEHQDVEISLNMLAPEQFKDKLLNEDIDFGILKMYSTVLESFDKQLFQITLLRKEAFFALMAKGTEPKGKTSIRLPDFVNMPILSGPNDSMLQRHLRRYYQAAGHTPVLSPLSSDDERTLLPAEQGMGVLFAGESAAVYYKDQYRYAMLPLEPPDYNNVYLIHLKSMKLTAFDRAFIRELSEYLQQDVHKLCSPQEAEK